MPRKPLKKRNNKNTEDTKNNRISPLLDKIKGLEDVDDIMSEIMDILKDTEMVPEVGSFYTFVYSPKTANIRFDEYPLVEVTSIFSWGFVGINYHYPAVRQYTWEQIVSPIYKINPSEIKSISSIPYKKFKINS
jgi:hypothetical protein